MSNETLLGGEEVEPLRHRLRTRLEHMLTDAYVLDKSKVATAHVLKELHRILGEVHKNDIEECIENIGDDEYMVSLFATILEAYCVENNLFALVACNKSDKVQHVTIFDNDDPDVDTEDDGLPHPAVIVVVEDEGLEGLGEDPPL